MSVLILIVGVILFIALIIVHEFGHFWVAKRNGVVAEEFGIFFPPRLFKRKTKGGWTFSINLLPIGGFVKLKGEHDSDVEPGSFGAASTWSKSKIMAAGVFMNLLAALVLFTILGWIGMPQIIPNQFSVSGGSHIVNREMLVIDVEKDSPAAAVGLKPQSQIIAIGTPGHLTAVNSLSGIQNLTAKFAAKRVEVEYKTNGSVYFRQTTLRSTGSAYNAALGLNPSSRIVAVGPSGKMVNVTTAAELPVLAKRFANGTVNISYVLFGKTQLLKDVYLPTVPAYLGVDLPPTPLIMKRYSWWAAPVEAVGLMVQITKLSFVGLGHAVAGLGKIIAGAVTGNNIAREHGQASASKQVAGPIGIFFILRDGSLLGYQYMLFIIAIISLTLAIMNILPIPALDGGRLWLMLISRGFKRRLSSSVEEVVNAVGMFILLILIALVTLVDVHRFL